LIITTDRLIHLAKEEVKSRAERPGLIAAFLVGSVLENEPLLGGCTDVDIVLIHSTVQLQPREFKRLSRQVHLDIHHYTKQDFENPRQLRTDPLLGCSLCKSLRLHDPDHFFDWAHAAACARFNRPDNKLARAHILLDQSRSQRSRLDQANPLWPSNLQQAAWDGVNALCCLERQPALGRRAVLKLRAQLQSLDALSHYSKFLDFFQVDRMDQWNVPAWLTGFGKAFDLAIQLKQSAHFNPVRRDYFLKAFQSLAETGNPEAAVLSMLKFWPLPLNNEDPMLQLVEEAKTRQSMLAATGFVDESYDQKLMKLEALLDDIELFIEDWGVAHGA
jgi:hypothetical protein